MPSGCDRSVSKLGLCGVGWRCAPQQTIYKQALIDRWCREFWCHHSACTLFHVVASLMLQTVGVCFVHQLQLQVAGVQSFLQSI